MKTPWLRLVALAFAGGLMAACSKPAPQPIRSPADPTAAPPSAEAQIGFTEEPRTGRFLALHAAFLASVDPDGALRLSPRAGRARSPVTIRTASIRRGEERLDGPASAQRSFGGGVRVARGAAEEALEIGPQGIAQSWRFAERPPGEGDLQVALEISGASSATPAPSGHRLALAPGSGAFVYGLATWVDARGRTAPVPARLTGGRLVLTVPAETLDQSDFPAVLDPVISAEIAPDEAVYHAGARAGEAAVAFDGTNFLVAWVWSSTEIRAARVAPDGTELDWNGFRVSEANSSPKQRPAVAFDGTSYLVVWQERWSDADIKGALVGTDGTLLSPTALVIAPGGANHNVNPSVASLGTEFLVAWDRFTTAPGTGAIAVRFVGPTGAFLSGEFAIRSVSLGGYLRTPSVAAGGSNYFVAYAIGSSTTNYDIEGVTLNAGSSSYPRTSVCTAAGDQTEPAATYGGGRFFVAWADARTSSATDVYAARVGLDANGFLVSGGTGTQDQPAVAHDGTNFVVALANDYGQVGSDDVVLHRISSSGTSAGSAMLTADTGTRPAVASGASGALVAWELLGGFGVSARFAAATGTLQAGETTITFSANSQTYPALAFDGTNHLAIWTDSRDGADATYGARISAAGTALDPSGVKILDYASRSAAFDGTQFQVAAPGVLQRVSTAGAKTGSTTISAAAGTAGVAVACRTGLCLAAWAKWASTSGSIDLLAARVDATGALLDPSEVAVSAAPGMQDKPAIASDGTGFLVAWQDARGGTADVYAGRVTALGAVLDGNGVLVGTTGQSQTDLSVAFGGATYFVVYAKGTTVEARLLSAAAAPLGPAFTVATGAASSPAPRVAWDGFGFFVVYEGTADVFGLRYREDGTLLMGKTALTSTSANERAPAVARGAPGEALVAYHRTFGPPESAARVRAVRVGFLPDGTACSRSADCRTGHCIDGVCCATACGLGSAGDCQACSVAAGAPADGTCAAVPAGRVCRTAAGPCDAAESCDGLGLACPSDAFLGAGVACRASSGPCEAAAACTGSGASCPSSFLAAGTECRASAGPCDVAETCDGASASCAADAFRGPTTACRAAAGPCDLAELCPGNSAACPGDAFAPSGTVCRAAAPCNPADLCSGTGASCPADAPAADGASCDDGNACTRSDQCSAGACVGRDPLACPAGECQLANACNPQSGTCVATPASDGSPCSGGTCVAGACVPTGADAGAADAGSLAGDASPDPRADAGSAVADAGPAGPGPDASGAPPDAGAAAGAGGCGCHASGAPGAGAWLPVALGLLLGTLGRRRRG